MDTNISLVDHKYENSSTHNAPNNYEPPTLGIPGQNISLIPQTNNEISGNIAIGIPGVPQQNSYAPPPTMSAMGPGAAPAIQAPPPANQAFCGPLSLEYYMPYFDVNTEEVKQRLIAPFYSNREDFFFNLQGKPDLWGPFWVYTTLVFIVGVCGNLANWLGHDPKKTDAVFHFEISYFPTAAGLIFGCGTVFPILFNFFISQMAEAKSDFVQAICHYGYTTGIWLPAAFLSFLPSSILQWVFLLYATVATSMFIIMNYWKDLIKLSENRKYFLIGCIITNQLIMLLVFKLSFYSFTEWPAKAAPAPQQPQAAPTPAPQQPANEAKPITPGGH